MSRKNLLHGHWVAGDRWQTKRQVKSEVGSLVGVKVPNPRDVFVQNVRIQLMLWTIVVIALAISNEFAATKDNAAAQGNGQVAVRELVKLRC